MGSLEIAYDARLRQFVIPVMIVRRAGPSGPKMTTAELIVDTGSNTSAINEETARKLDIDPQGLQAREVMGIGAYTQERVITEPMALYLGEAFGEVELHEMFVYLPLSKKYRKKTGIGTVRGEKKAPAPNIFGMDALSKISGAPGRLYIDSGTRSGHIDW
jgi:Aspartyl protease